MEDFKRNEESREREIVFSRTVKAGKRIYYIDVKRNRKDELYLALTESKKIVNGTDGDNVNVVFEKHKIFLYKEDFEKFMDSINEAIGFIEAEQGKAEPRPEYSEDPVASDSNEEIKIDVEF